MEAPAAGTRAACPGCGQLFETPADPDESAPPFPRRGRPEYGYEGEGGYGRPAQGGHSGLGVASFIIGLVVIALTLLIIVLAVIVSVGSPPGDTAYRMGMMVGTVVCGELVVCLVGVGLGIGGLFQGNRSRTLAVIGVILNGLVLFGGIVLMLIGMAFANRH
jgi:hypothetical protein